MLATLTALCLTTACRPTAAFEPLQQGQRTSAVVSAAGCATVAFRIVDDSAVTVTFPDSAACHASLHLIQDGDPIYDRNDDRKVRIPVRVVNRGGEAVLLPVELLLAADSVTVLDPPGTTNNKIKLLNVDSVIPAGEAWAGAEVWRIGGDSGTLAPGDSTETRRLRFKVNMPALEGRLAFVAQAPPASQDTTRPPLPDSTLWPLVNPRLTSWPLNPEEQYYRDVLGIEFQPEASGAAVNSFLVRFEGLVIGGFSVGDGDFYVVRVPDPGEDHTAVDSLVSLMTADPAVKTVVTLSYKGKIDLRGRFPIDSGVASTGSAWTGSGNPGTRPWISIRAPLAWGCANGEYGGTVPIAIVDAYFSGPVHTDLAPSLTSVTTPVPTEMVGDPQLYASAKDHGWAVAGVLSAQGDNGQFMAGMTWRSNLRTYALGLGTNRHVNPPAYLAAALLSAGADGRRVVNLSVGIGDGTNPGQVDIIRRALQTYLNSGQDRLVVQAVGDSGLTLDPTQVLGSTDPQITALDKALVGLSQQPAYAGKIVFVAGSDQGGQRSPTTNVWTGAPIVAAPSEDIVSLAEGNLMAMYPGTFTSYATPFVAGLATLLWEMAPSLTAPEVSEYIRRGAQVTTIDSTTGAAVPAQDIGVPGVYQINAYGSLALLSQERNDVPFCGVPLFGENGAIEVGRATTQILPVPAQVGAPFSFSAAQGGRLLSISGTDGSFLVNHLGAVLSGGPGAPARMFTERDTVTVLPPDTLLLEGPAGPRGVSLSPIGQGTTATLALTAEASPSGEDVAVMGHYRLANFSTVQRFRLIKVATGAITTVADVTIPPQTDECSGAGIVEVEWSHDSRHVLFTRHLISGGPGCPSTIPHVSTELTRHTVGGGTTTITINDLQLLHLAFSGGDEVFYATEVTTDTLGAPSGCALVRRVTATPSSRTELGPVSTTGGCPFDGGQIGRQIPNVMAQRSGLGSVLGRRRR